MLGSDFRLTVEKSESGLEGFVGFVNCFGALGEEGFFLVVEVKFHDFLHTVAADDGGNADAEVALAVFALEQAGAGDELLLVAEDGGNISQGQKQLLCIARVMLCLPPMLILDEATSSIDTRTEVRIQAAFARMMQGRTSFIVAHRLSTIREADVILVMKDGHIVEQGDHDALLAQGGFYAKLYNSQFEGVET